MAEMQQTKINTRSNSTWKKLKMTKKLKSVTTGYIAFEGSYLEWWLLLLLYSGALLFCHLVWWNRIPSVEFRMPSRAQFVPRSSICVLRGANPVVQLHTGRNPRAFSLANEKSWPTHLPSSLEVPSRRCLVHRYLKNHYASVGAKLTRFSVCIDFTHVRIKYIVTSFFAGRVRRMVVVDY